MTKWSADIDPWERIKELEYSLSQALARETEKIKEINKLRKELLETQKENEK